MKTLKSKILKLDILSVLIALIVFCVILGIFAEGFFSKITFVSIGKQTAVTILVGLAQMVVLSQGQFNLALGSIGCMAAYTYAASLQLAELPFVLALLIAVVIGILFGAVQGLLIAKSKLNPFIITLALDSIFEGLATVIFKGGNFNRLPDVVKQINKSMILGVPLLLWIALVVVAIMYVFFNHTYMGRNMLAAGESKAAATIAGIHADRQTVLAHCLSGCLAAIAGVLSVSRMGAAQLSIGSDWMIISFTAPVLGGTLLSGGKVAVIGTIFGALLMSVINSGLSLLNISYYWTQTFLGIILLASFAMDYLRQTALKSGH